MTDGRSFAAIFAGLPTDKQTIHQYGEGYDVILARHRSSARKVLELGVLKGGSLTGWREAFPLAEITGVDVNPPARLEAGVTFIHHDAYDREFVDSLPNDWDVIVDDGPHSLESMQFVAASYTRKLAPGGTLVIEDVILAAWLPVIAASVPAEMRDRVYVVDRTLTGADWPYDGERNSRLFVVDLGGGSL